MNHLTTLITLPILRAKKYVLNTNIEILLN
jgi:hypothetical protein